MYKLIIALPLAALAACGSSSTSTISETVTTVPTTINGVPVDADNIGDQPGVTVTTGADQTEEDRLAEIAELDAELGFSSQDYLRVSRDINAANLEDRANSRFTAIQQSGTAEFEGLITLFIPKENPTGDTLFGQSVVTLAANFDGSAKTVTADIDGFVGVTDGSELFSYAGDISLTNGRIGARVPNDIGFDIAGSVTGGGNTIGVSGPFDGKFVGTPLRGINMRDGQDGTVTVTLNGRTVSNGVVDLLALPK